ncbi:MAG TPA: hypothetical protein VI540_03695 [Gaiellaceae bacterium]|nr:hypothetical protein [Gaiellaceae bacterium]
MAAPALEQTFALVESAVGRRLRQSERAIDVLLLHGALERAKNELDAAISEEMLRATRSWIRSAQPTPYPQLELTKEILAPLEELHALGLEEAMNELERAGYGFDEQTERFLAAPDPLPGGGFESLQNTVRRGLLGIGIRISDDLVAVDLSAASSAMIGQALLNVPGARDLASRVVSTALYSGMGATFEENEDLVDGFEYSAVLDAATCSECWPLDGTTYPSWAAIQEVLPGGGPNPACLGGGRCRCRAVPAPA